HRQRNGPGSGASVKRSTIHVQRNAPLGMASRRAQTLGSPADPVIVVFKSNEVPVGRIRRALFRNRSGIGRFYEREPRSRQSRTGVRDLPVCVDTWLHVSIGGALHEVVAGVRQWLSLSELDANPD